MVAAFVVLLALAPVSAQHGGGHASGGGHGGMASHGGFGGHSGGGHAFGGTHSGGGFGARPSARGSFNRSFSNRSFTDRSPSSRNFNRFRGSRIRNRGFRSSGFRDNCWWFGCGWGYAYPYLGGGIDPYWWWDSGSSDDPQYRAGGNWNNQQEAEQGVGQQGDQDLYARSAPPPPREHVELNEAAPATVLVFRDEHKQEIHNYAIVGQTLWNFNPQHTQKIPLSDLDIPATTKENEDRGVDFRLPGGREGQ
jgi:hypothetical protein